MQGESLVLEVTIILWWTLNSYGGWLNTSDAVMNLELKERPGIRENGKKKRSPSRWETVWYDITFVLQNEWFHGSCISGQEGPVSETPASLSSRGLLSHIITTFLGNFIELFLKRFMCTAVMGKLAILTHCKRMLLKRETLLVKTDKWLRDISLSLNSVLM